MKKPNIDTLLESITVHEPGTWDNDSGPKGWHAISDDNGIIGYTQFEEHAFAFRLLLINALLNPIADRVTIGIPKVEIPKGESSITPAPTTPHEIQPQVEINGEEILIIWKPGGMAVWTHPDGGVGVVQIKDQIDGNIYTIIDKGNGNIEHTVSRHDLSLYAVGNLKYGDTVLVSPPDDSDVWPKPFKGVICKFVAHYGKRSAIIADDKNQWYTVPFEKFTKDIWAG